ncbi:class I SAM-dependent methyltransferase [Symbioplanes lichenis]|uniref:class I SAM-dependent methyltransferase n=1 Tax=Symbioplanes lichenis TaxID=1629072 RepID=UPI002738FCF3|nr:class I SAM-dependent methyltransferase [Actinoplanes lichenis]
MSDADPTPALTAIGGLGLAAEQAALIRGALASGFLARCRTSVTAAELTAQTGLPHVPALCTALVAAGVLTAAGDDAYRVSDDYAGLFTAGADSFALRALQGVAVRERLVESHFSAAGSGSYWEVTDADRAALAASVTVDPATDFGRGAMAATIEAIPEVRDLVHGDARYLELGCGLSGALLSLLQLYPKLTAVAVDLAADLVARARAQSEALGVSDRVRFEVGDAAEFTDDEPFDLAFWSQFFYPARWRERTLANAYARLRPGGWLAAPALIVDGDQLAAPDAALNALMVSAWDVPVRTAAGLVAELEAAGFVDATARTGPVNTTVVARRP